jgi:hypothetical protein
MGNYYHCYCSAILSANCSAILSVCVCWCGRSGPIHGVARFDDWEWPTSRAGCDLLASPSLVAGEVFDGHHLVAVGTAAAWAYPPAEELAVGAALLAEIA